MAQPVAVGADQVCEAFAEMWRTLGRCGAGATLSEADGLFAVTTGVATPMLNGVFALAHRVDAAAAAALAAEVDGTGLPWCMQAREGAAGTLAPIARDRGLVAGPRIPLMVARAVAAPQQQVPLDVVGLEAADLEQHVEVGAAGFEMPVDVYRDSVRAIACLPGLRAWVGRVNGEPVTTLVTIPTAGDSVGVFNVATPPRHRRQGFGGALTAAALKEAFDAGARWAWLQSSAAGYRVYQRIGFQTVEGWALWYRE